MFTFAVIVTVSVPAPVKFNLDITTFVPPFSEDTEFVKSELA